jgi:DNA-binding response OmpR family regulator
VVVGFNLRDGNGLDLYRQILARMVGECRPPILIVAGASNTDEVVTALEAGAFYCVEKPYKFLELHARIRAALRANRNMPAPKGIQAFGDFRLSLDEHVLRYADRSVNLTWREFGILSALMEYPGKILSRHEILTGVWGSTLDTTKWVVDVHISRIRRKLGKAASVIETIPGVGFRLAVPKMTLESCCERN